MADLIGRHLGQYEIIALLGEGGMATVYRARQKSVRREVAVKVIDPRLVKTAQFIARFEREAQTVASLSHPHILKVFDYGQEDDLVYLVMELLTGGSLAEWIRKGPLPPVVASRLLDQIAPALDYAHRRSIIHRDLKPQNVLLDEDQNAFLSDFGIAKLLDETTVLTHPGAVMGTPAYMAPEQWKGGELVDSRSDIYALGIILFEMLTGRLPFAGDTPFRIMHMHIYEPPPLVQQVMPQLPSGIDQVIGKALAKDREERFVSASSLAEAFKDALHRSTQVSDGTHSALADAAKPDLHTPTVIGSEAEASSDVPTRRSPAAEPSRRRTSILGIAVTAALLIVAFLVGSFFARRATGPTPTIAESSEIPTATPGLAATNTESPARTFVLAPVVPADRQTQTALAPGTQTAVAVAALSTKTSAPTSTTTSTATPVPPTVTLTVSRTNTPFKTAAPTSTNTLTATLVPPTVTLTASRTNAPMPTNSVTPMPTSTKTVTATLVPSTATLTPSRTKTPTPTSTPAPASTTTSTATVTPRPSITPMPTQTVTPTSTPSEVPATPTPTSALTSTLTPTPTSVLPTASPVRGTATMTNTPSPLDQGLKLVACGSADDLCIYTRQGTVTPLGLGATYTRFLGASWAPDGSRFVFGACRRTTPPRDSCFDIFIANRDGSNVKVLVRDAITPAWSPDGKWIAFYVGGKGVTVSRPDGSGIKVVAAITGDKSWLPIAWSPDSKQLASASLLNLEKMSSAVVLFNQDGSGGTRVVITVNSRISRLAWSPDGKSVVVQQTSGPAYQVDANCKSTPTGCDDTSRKVIGSVPEHWLSNFYPQWAGEATLARTSSTAPTNTAATRASRVPGSPEQGMRVDTCGYDLCIFPHPGQSIPLGLSKSYTQFSGATWSPTGTQTVFAACPSNDAKNPACQGLYIVDLAGGKVTPVFQDPKNPQHFTARSPAWSPDGQWIVFDLDNTLSIIRPNGSGKKQLISYGGTSAAPYAIPLPLAWSPDSKQIALLVSQVHQPVWDAPDRVWVINRDGSGGVRTILKSDAPLSALAWSPDGKVVVALEDGTVYKIDPSCKSTSSGCDPSSRTVTSSIPEHWLASFYPQWAGEMVSR